MGYYDANDYSIVETGPASWGVQYRNGPFFGGMASRDQALEYAHSVALANPVNNSAASTEPRTLAEAQAQAQAARDQYRKFLATTNNDLDDRQIYEAAIAAADATVTRFSSQQALIGQTTAATSYADIDRTQQLAEADAQRVALADYARNLRYSPFLDPVAISAADQKAIQAELYYESLRDQQSQIGNAVGSTTVKDVLQPQIANTYVGAPTTITQPQTPDPLTTGSTAPPAGNQGMANTNPVSLPAGAASQLNNQITSLGDTLSNAANGTTGNNTTYTPSSNSASASDADRRIKIAYKKGSYSGILAPLEKTSGMIFPFTPVITYKGSTNYNVLATPHANQDWHIYQNTASVQIAISGVFTAQNPDEAKYMLAALQFLRSVSKMHFGEKDSNKGLPPPQCLLTGYGDYMFNRLSVIVNDFSIELPNTVDYVEVNTGDGVSDVPSVTTINVSLTVQNTPKKNREFNWDEFASGKQVKDGGWI